MVTEKTNRVDKYELGRTLGEGTFSKVKYARHVETGESFAIKIMNKNNVLAEGLCERVMREISIMKRLNHPNILKLHQVLATKTKIYLVLEYASGGELFEKVYTQGRLTEDLARKYFHQLIDAVDYCHSHGVYHRDLKLENLLLDSDGNLKVSDFGLSALSQQSKGDVILQTRCGTNNYAAPEMWNLREGGYDGAKADVWSCGVILYVLLVGCFPFDDVSIPYLIRKMSRADIKCPRGVSRSAEQLIKRILNPNPKDRIDIAQIIQDPWFLIGYKLPCDNGSSSFSVDQHGSEGDGVKEHDLVRKPTLMNAFDLIATLNKGSYLEDVLAEQECQTCEYHFTSQHSALEIMTKMEDVAKTLGFSVQTSNYKMKLNLHRMRSELSLEAEVFDIASSLFMVEVRKISGSTLEYHDFYLSFSSGLKDIILPEDVYQWHIGAPPLA